MYVLCDSSSALAGLCCWCFMVDALGLQFCIKYYVLVIFSKQSCVGCSVNRLNVKVISVLCLQCNVLSVKS